MSERSREEPDKVCAADGQVIGDEQGTPELWCEYFAGLLQGVPRWQMMGLVMLQVFCKKRMTLVVRKLLQRRKAKQ